MALEVANITETIAPAGAQPIAYGQGGLEVEFFRVTFSGGITLNDTITIAPRFITNIRAVQANWSVTDGLSSSTSNSSVTLALRTSAASAVSGSFMVQLIGQR